MRQYVFPSLLVCVLLGAVHVLRSDETAAPRNASDIALIDMAKVFKSYHRFEELREELKKEIAAADVLGKEMNAEIASLKRAQEAARSAKDFEQAEKLENKLSRATDEQAKFVKDSQKQFIKKEAEIYRTVYGEVSDLAKAYCREKRIKLVMRFASEGIPDAKAEPSEILQSMSRQVVYEEGLDITDEIIRRANMTAAK